MKGWGAFNLAMQLSWTLLFSLLLPLLGGIWLDKKLGTTPLFVLLGAVLGVLAATVGVARMAVRLFPTVASKEPEEPRLDTKGEEEPE